MKAPKKFCDIRRKNRGPEIIFEEKLDSGTVRRVGMGPFVAITTLTQTTTIIASVGVI
jgi:hypothetical protein